MIGEIALAEESAVASGKTHDLVSDPPLVIGIAATLSDVTIAPCHVRIPEYLPGSRRFAVGQKSPRRVGVLRELALRCAPVTGDDVADGKSAFGVVNALLQQ